MDQQIRSHIYDYLSGATDLEAFEEWFVGETWDERSSLASAVDHLLVDRGAMTRQEFNSELLSLTSTVFLDLTAAAGTIRITSAPRAAGPETPVIQENLEFAGR